MSEPSNSPDLRNHSAQLTEIIQELFQSESLHAQTVGQVMRGIRAGVERVSLSIARDPAIDFEEVGRTLRTLSLIHKAIDEAFIPTAMPMAKRMKPLKRV